MDRNFLQANNYRPRDRSAIRSRGGGGVPAPAFSLPFLDAGSGAVNVTPGRGTGSATFTRAGATATTVLSTGLVSSTIAANTARSYYDPAPVGGGGSYMYLPGVSGAYASTPDSAAVSITGDIDIRVQVAATDWTPSATQYFIAKFATAGQRSFRFGLLSSGALNFIVSADGTNNTNSYNSSASVAFSDGAIGWVRVTRSSSTGDANFYSSTDGLVWTLLGITQTSTAGNIFDGTDAVEVGSINGGGANQFNGRIYRAQIYNGINGTLVADFDPTRTTQASTSFAASTGETWTINGRGFIYAAPLYLGYLAEEARTNLCLQSDAAENAAWGNTSVSVSADQIASPDGGTNADKLNETALTSNHLNYPSAAITVTANTTYTASRFFKAGERTKGRLYWETGGFGSGCYVDFDLQAGTIGTVTAFGTGTATSASIQAFPNGWYRVSVTGKIDAVSVGGYITTALRDAAGSISYLGVVNTGFYVYGAQVEAGAFATSYIPTAAATSTRAADVLTYPIAGNFDNTVGTAFARVTLDRASNAAGGGQNIIGASGGATNAIYYHANGRPTIYDGTATAAVLSTVAANTTARLSSSWGGTTLSMYLNGGSKGTAAFDGSMNFATIAIGDVAGAAGACNGCIRDVRIWQRVLSDSQIASIT